MKSKEGSAMVQMGDRDACDRVIHNLNTASCFGNKLSIRYGVCLLFSCYSSDTTSLLILSSATVIFEVTSPYVTYFITMPFTVKPIYFSRSLYFTNIATLANS